RLLRAQRGLGSEDDDYLDLASHQLRRQRGQLVVFALRPTLLEDNVLVFDIAELAQALLHPEHPSGAFGCALRAEEADPEDFGPLLAERNARQRERADPDDGLATRNHAAILGTLRRP